MPERNFLLPVFRIHNDFPLCYHFLHYTTTQHFFTIFNNFFVHFRLFSCIFITYVCLSDKFECRVLFRICQNPDMAVRQMLIVYLQRIFHLNRNLFLFLLHIHTVVILVAAVIVILYTLMIMPGVKSNIRSIYSDYLLDLSISYGREMESAMQVNIDLLDNPEAAQDILQQLDIAGAKTAYAYLVGFDGTMLYHPSAEKIGQPVENDAVKKMLKEIQGGSIPKPETVQYVFQGEKKFSACYTSKKQFILVVTADDAELLAPALMLEQRGILISGVLLLLGALAAFVFATRITRPLSKITDSVNRIAQLDLRNDQVLSTLLPYLLYNFRQSLFHPKHGICNASDFPTMCGSRVDSCLMRRKR